MFYSPSILYFLRVSKPFSRFFTPTEKRGETEIFPLVDGSPGSGSYDYPYIVNFPKEEISVRITYPNNPKDRIVEIFPTSELTKRLRVKPKRETFRSLGELAAVEAEKELALGGRAAFAAAYAV